MRPETPLDERGVNHRVTWARHEGVPPGRLLLTAAMSRLVLVLALMPARPTAGPAFVHALRLACPGTVRSLDKACRLWCRVLRHEGTASRADARCALALLRLNGAIG
jgi:hypothetical protein